MAGLDEDAVAALHDRIRRARNKYTGQYRRGAAQRVSKTGGRGKAFVKNQRARDKAEVFEDALARVSRRLSVLAKQSAADLKAERLAAAAAAKAGQKPAAGKPSATAPKGAGPRSAGTRRCVLPAPSDGVRTPVPRGPAAGQARFQGLSARTTHGRRLQAWPTRSGRNSHPASRPPS